jgi:uracil-DNA glycosylase
MTSFRNQLHPSWAQALEDLLPLLDEIESNLQRENYLPIHENVMRALTSDLSNCKVLIVGQDPYPNSEHAMGLAFSIPVKVTKLPATLRNIFKELDSDLGLGEPVSGDLTSWHEQGVVLLNRTLTCRSGESNSHINLGWREITDRCAEVLAMQGAVAILWGNNASELSHFFSHVKVIASVHPSPLSAYRGFFGSKPFSQVNMALEREGKRAINWV